jgi:predicted GNAT superfamily acetyltransferase
VEAIIAGHAPPRDILDTVDVPAAIDAIRRDDPKRAREIQRATGAKFQRLLEQGLAVIGFRRSQEKGTYLFGQLP